MPAKAVTALRLVRGAPSTPHVEPVSAGIPFARATVRRPEQIAVVDSAGRRLASDATPLAHWPDGSLRWVLVDCLVAASGSREDSIAIELCDDTASPAPPIACTLRASHYAIDTGAVRLDVPCDLFTPFASLHRSDAVEPCAAVAALRCDDAASRRLSPRLHTVAVDRSGTTRLTLLAQGELRAPDGGALCRFAARVSVFAGLGLVRLDFTLHNPRRARHRGGLWDLGDPGSIFFRSLCIDARLQGVERPRTAFQLNDASRPHAEPEPIQTADRVEIDQASSGGEQWASRNHVDRTGRVPLPFRGCRIVADQHVEYRDRVAPVVMQVGAGLHLSATCTRFWQQFPSRLVAHADGLRVGVFPPQGDDPFELQGGERSTHTLFFQLAPEHAEATDLHWVHDPLIAVLSPEYVEASAAFRHFVPAARDPHTDYLRLTQEGLEGPHSFFAKREAIDEYGWRHFGDTWADHEDLHHTGEHPVISHYNNQYDLVFGFLLHFARSADPRWFELAADLARHVIDVDLYHTDDDKPAYSGGLFWHTAHYEDAGRATHRSYSADCRAARAGRSFGGGPSCENNYTTGLLLYHCFTGDPRARAAVLQLADWVLRMDDGGRSLLGEIDPGPSGLASYTRTFAYHGPGRGAGNSINALLDAHWLSGSAPYLTAAEALIARCIHPRDDPDRLALDDPESRWSYTVFLQALGKYLDHKRELGAHDASFDYARASLVRYADWMLAHESPFMTRFDRVEHPTESWPAQDLRKSCVFDYAAQYGPESLRPRATAAAELFFSESMRGVASFETRACTRPLAVLLANGVQRAAFRLHPPAAPPAAPAVDWGTPSGFRAQKERVRRRLRTPSGWLALARAAARVRVWRRITGGRIW